MLLSSWIYSLKWCYFLLLLTTIHGWSSHGIVPASRTSACMAPHCPAHTQSQQLGHNYVVCKNYSTKSRCWQHTKGVKPLPLAMLPFWANRAKGRETQCLSAAQSSIWQQVHQGSYHDEQNCRLLQSFCRQTCASWYFSSFLSSVYLRDLLCCWLWGETEENN